MTDIPEIQEGANGSLPSQDKEQLGTRADRVTELENSFLALRREWREIAIEWESTYNQFRALYARLNRRDAREAEKNEKVEVPLNPAALALLNSRKGE